MIIDSLTSLFIRNILHNCTSHNSLKLNQSKNAVSDDFIGSMRRNSHVENTAILQQKHHV